MKRTIFVASLLAIGVTAAIAQSNVVEQRQGLMKEMAAQTRPIGGMMRGQEPFDLAKVQSGLFSLKARRTRRRRKPCQPSGKTRPSSNPLWLNSARMLRLRWPRSRTRQPSRRRCRRYCRTAAPATTTSGRRVPKSSQTHGGPFKR
jgi:hypothetical protein